VVAEHLLEVRARDAAAGWDLPLRVDEQAHFAGAGTR
jgi:hypothetical protein